MARRLLTRALCRWVVLVMMLPTLIPNLGWCSWVSDSTSDANLIVQVDADAGAPADGAIGVSQYPTVNGTALGRVTFVRSLNVTVDWCIDYAIGIGGTVYSDFWADYGSIPAGTIDTVALTRYPAITVPVEEGLLPYTTYVSTVYGGLECRYNATNGTVILGTGANDYHEWETGRNIWVR